MELGIDPNDPDRHFKRLQKAIAVTSRIASLASRRRKTRIIETPAEKLAKIVKHAKDSRQQRNLEIGINHRYLFEMLATFFSIDEDEVAECAIDSIENMSLIGSLFTRNGVRSILVQYQLSDPPSKDSGRYDVKFKNQKVKTVLFSNAKNGEKIVGLSVIVYRLTNLSDIDPKNVSDEIFFTMLEEGESVIDSIGNNLATIYRPALSSVNFENCTDARKNDFVHSNEHFIGFLKSTHHDLQTCNIKFQVDHELFKGCLLVPHQIRETSKKREKVAQVEIAFITWMKQIKIVISNGNQLVGFGPGDGPLAELEHWRHMLTKFNYVLEFTNSRAFINFLQCLKYSRSKLIKSWDNVESELISLTNEAMDNVKYLTLIEQYWEPLYREGPLKIVESIPYLLQAIRNVYNQSRFYNNDLRMTGLFSKVVNQLIVASQNYLTKNHQISIWDEEIDKLVDKIGECKTLEREFRRSYSKLLQEMMDNEKSTFFCSENYLFERYNSFEKRLMKIQEVMIVSMRYEVLDRIKISGMEKFSNQIKGAYEIISKKSYDPLAYRIKTFDEDYMGFQQEIIKIETDMGNFVKNYFEQIDNLEMRILTLRRFEALNLQCLNLDRRYLDIVKSLEKEIEDIKDKYNEERANPPKEWNVPPVVGRITWARCLMKKIKEPIDVLKKNECVIKHPNAQLSVKYYNYLVPILMHYEAMHHKAWFCYADEIRSRFELPIIRMNVENNHYELNLDESVLQIMKETKSMVKLGLEVPPTAQTLSYCEDIILNTYNVTRKLVERNNSLRSSIYPIFLPLMRIHLIKLERVFAPALSTVTWVSLNLEEYFTSIDKVLKPIEDFVKEISDINDCQIENFLKEIETFSLILLPSQATDPEELKFLNDQNRIKIEKKIELKSIAAERAAISLITKFIDISDIPTIDNSGKFQLPPDEINESNWRAEEYKPIDRYDWLSFEKLYKAVSYESPEENLILCFKPYDGLDYDVELLHIDCTELFAYYNQRLISTFVKTTKRNMERMKIRSNFQVMLSGTCCHELKEKSLLRASIELKKPNFVLVPNIRQLQTYFDKLLLNIVETFYGVNTWGKNAKTEERRKRKPLLDEVRHEKNWFKTISEHNEIIRYSLGFTDSILHFEKKINGILNDFREKFRDLWNVNRENELKKFVESQPLLADVRDKFKYFDETTTNIKEMEKVICVQTIEIHCEKMIEALIIESTAWKEILGSKLSAKYRLMMKEIVDFIHVMTRKMSRKLEDIDDCSKIFTLLNEIQENFYTFDRNLDTLEEIYKIFADFEIDIPHEDFDVIFGLRYNFKIFMDSANKVHQEAIKRQESLLNELTQNVIEFQDDILKFENDFNSIGPTMPGISIKESSNRAMFFDIRLQELLRRLELYEMNEKIVGLPVNDYPNLKTRECQMDAINTLYKLYWDYQKFSERYAEKQFKILDMSCIVNEFEKLSHRSMEIENLPGDTKQLPAYEKVRSDIDLYSKKLPLLELLANPAIEESQWTEIENSTGYKFDSQSENFTLSVILESPLLEYSNEVEKICRIAIKQKEDEAKDDFLFGSRK